MSTGDPLVRNISDTALLAAIYRARETEGSDAVFRDPFARRLAGERGDQIAKSMPFSIYCGWLRGNNTSFGSKFRSRMWPKKTSACFRLSRIPSKASEEIMIASEDV